MRIIEKPIESARGRIWGELILPDAMSDAPLPLVIYSHGFDADADHALKYADAITNAGLALYTFDFRGGSTHSRSAGTPLDMSALTEVADLTEVIDALAADPRIDAENVFLLGASFGGLVSALVAARMPGRIRGLALHYPAFCIPDDLRARFANPVDVPESFFCLSMDVGQRYATDALGLDPYAEIATYTGDVLITHGSTDDLVDVSYSRRAAVTYANAELHVIDGAGHGFQGSALDASASYLADFLTRHVVRS